MLDAHAAAVTPGERLLVSRARQRVRGLQGCPVRDTLAATMGLLMQAEEEGLEHERAALLIMISLAHSRLGNVGPAKVVARQAVELAEQVGDVALIADALARLALMVSETDPLDAVALYDRALALYTRLGDRYGQGRCHVNTGLAHGRYGDIAAAESAYLVAIELARSAHTPEIASAALLNLGVIYMKSRGDEEARKCFDEALHLSGVSRIGLHRLVARYNLANLARDRGDAESALELYQTAAHDAQELGQLDIEVGALAGCGLAALALGRPDVAAAGLQRIGAALALRREWWFQGRELVEALRVRLELERGTAATAAREFEHAVAQAESQDPYGAAWLVAECATPLAAAGLVAHWPLVERYAEVAEASGYLTLAARCRALLAGRAPATPEPLQLAG
jgi:tetratricopeptide (TPR) repeat protein